MVIHHAYYLQVTEKKFMISNQMPEPVSHVIFDFDGLLVDTESAYTKANSECLKEFGHEFTMDLKRRK